MEIYKASVGVSSCGANESRVLVGRASSRMSSVGRQEREVLERLEPGPPDCVSGSHEGFENGRSGHERCPCLTWPFDRYSARSSGPQPATLRASVWSPDAPERHLLRPTLLRWPIRLSPPTCERLGAANATTNSGA